MNRCIAVYVTLLLSIFWLSVGFSQEDKEKIIQQAQQGILLKLTPEQIRAKLQQLGITEEEAIKRARERNVNLEQFLQQTTGGEIKTTQAPQISLPPTPGVPVLPMRLDTMAFPKEEIAVPTAFKDRAIAKDLKPFGYDIFQVGVTMFEPNVNVPIPPGYVLGPGDEILLNVWGDTQLSYQLAVSRDGYILIPNVGQVAVNGLTLDGLKRKLIDRMSMVYSSLRRGEPRATTFLDVSMGKLRTIQVFILGEVRRPGSYTLAGMATAFTALYYSGGPTAEGSLRDIRVMRETQTAGTIDFYDFALKGDKSKDVRLQDGDIVFVRFAGRRVALAGNVHKPAIYELKESERLADLIQLAGNLRHDADFKRVHVERIVPFEQRSQYERTILDIDVSFGSVGELQRSLFEMSDGDVVQVFGIRGELENRVTISGNVRKPGVYEYRAGMKVADLMMKADSLLEDTFGERGNILRTLPDLKKELIAFNVKGAIDGDPSANLGLQRLDEVTVFKETYFKPPHTVTISGAVRKPATFPRTERLTLTDLLVLAGGVTEQAELTQVKVSRMDTLSETKYSVVYDEVLPTDYWHASSRDPFYLEDFDHVEVLTNPRYTFQQFIQLKGEVRYPGLYAVRYEGESLVDIVKRAGGFKETAYLEGARFYRTVNNAQVQVPINLKRAFADLSSLDNPKVYGGDILDVPINKNVVVVTGEVYFPSGVLYKKGASLSYYLRQAGGPTQNAEASAAVVTLPNGSKWEPGWFIFPDPEILPGSYVSVPTKKEEKTETLQIIRDWALILMNTAAITIAIVQITK